MENTSTSTPWYADSASTSAASSGASTDKPLIAQAKEQTQRVIEQTQQKAGQAIDQARNQVVTQLEGQKERATGGIESVALALRQTGQHLREQDQGAMSGYAESAADALERFSGYINKRDVNQMIGEVEGFARRQPMLFLGSTFALGLLAGRFLKSSSPDHGSMSGQGSAALYPSGNYRTDTQDLANPIGAAGVAGTSAGSAGTTSPMGTQSSSPGRRSRAAGAASAGTIGASTPSATVDADDDGDLVTTNGTDTRSEGQP